LKTMKSSKSGSARTSRPQVSTKESWTKSNSKDCTKFWNLSCFGVWKRMLSKKSPPRLKWSFTVTWPTARGCYTRGLGLRYHTAIFTVFTTNRRWRT
jgi:hypothetical protein